MEGNKGQDQPPATGGVRPSLSAIRPPKIRRATLDDAEPILRAHRASVTALCARHYNPEQIRAWIARRQLTDYQSAVQNALVLVAEEENEVIGFSQLDLISGVIHALFVDPRHIGQGVGRSLLLAMEEEARRVGLRQIGVQATLNSVAFYQGRGYLPLRTVANTMADGTELPCVDMEKAL